jgi:lysophospholipase L1-like esterase
MIRRWHIVVLVALGIFALACEGGAGGATPQPSGSAKGYPTSMAALGDSITAGLGSCGTYVVCGRNSWATGTGDDLDSHYQRILAANAKIKGHAESFARPGAEADALAGQASKAVGMKAQYITVLIGANDACAGTVGAMTPVATFRNEIDKGLARLRKGLPKSRVLVASIPDLYRLWQVGHDNPEAVRVWKRLGVCPSMLANPTSTSDADDNRRKAVRQRIDDYNDALRDACRAYGKKCRWDGGRAHQVRFGLDRVSHADYFHPNFQGQRELADVTYPGRFTW